MATVNTHVFSPEHWSLEDIFDNDLFVSILPSSKKLFNNSQEYYTHFSPLIIEEVRAQIRYGLEKLDDANRRILPVSKVGHSYIQLYLPRPKKDERSDFIPGDFLLFTREDVVKHIDKYFFGVVNYYDDEGEVLHVTVFITKDRFGEDDLAVNDELYVCAVQNIITASRALRAIERREQPHFMFAVLRQAVVPSWGTFESEADKNWLAMLDFRTQELLEKVCRVSSPLNPAQKRAAARFLQEKGLSLIHGPPGCGKTTTTVNMIFTLLLKEPNVKVLQVAPTNVAVEVIATRFLDKLSRFDNISISECVLVGNKENINVTGVLGTILLENRIKRICEALMWGMNEHLIEQLLNDIAYNSDELNQITKDDNGTTLTPIANVIKILQEQNDNLAKAADVLLAELSWLLGDSSSLIFKATQQVIDKFIVLLKRLPSTSNLSTLSSAALSTCSTLQDYRRQLRMNAPFMFDPRIVKGHRGTIQSLVMDHARIIFSTVSTAGRGCITNRRDISAIIVDEAAQLVEAESLIILKRSCERLCLVGDPRQLSATVQSRRVEHHGYRLSMFERLLDNGWTPCLLDEQYRMHPKISAWPVREFYEGKLKDAPNTLSDEYKKSWHADNTCKPLLFFECADGREVRDDKHSFANHMEADIVCSQLTHWLGIVHSSPGSPMGRSSIGVITPYAAQVALLEPRLKNLGAKYSSDISIKSVDGFQGQERDVIIFSATRSNSNGKIGFLADHSRLNVAITRPKFALWVIGNSATLSTDRVWASFIDNCRMRGAYVNVLDQQVFHRTIREHTIIRPAKEFMENPKQGADTVFNANMWKLHFTQHAKDDLEDLVKAERKTVMKIFFIIAQGVRRKHPQNGADVDGYKDFVKVQAHSQLCVIWSVFLDNSGTQVIKIWRVVRSHHLQDSVKYVASLISESYTPELLDLCAIDTYISSSKRWAPTIFPMEACQFEWCKQVRTVATDEDQRASVTKSLATMKTFVVSSQVVKLLLEQELFKFEIPFEGSMEERELIEESGNAFILGRSGTGKTSVIVQRMLRTQVSDQARASSDETHEHVRQILITASPRLCKAIRKYYIKMLPSVGLDDEASRMHESELADDDNDIADDDELAGIPESFEGLKYPLFLTFRQFLYMVDGTLAKPFFAPKEAGANTLRTITEDDENIGGLHEDDDLDDDDIDVLLRRFQPNPRRQAGDGLLDSKPSRKHANHQMRAEVTFERFDSHFYRRFPRVTKHLSSAGLWTEFQSTIKGNIKNLLRPSGYLTREEYIALSFRNSALSATVRADIYDAFLAYERLKYKNGEWDMADASLYVFRAIFASGYTGDYVHYCYIDEVQDLLQTQIALISFISPDQSVVFAGDTAQTISAGVCFRFQDLRSLFFEMFGPRGALRNQFRPSTVPPVKHLTQNYRSTSGVLNLANSLVRILVHRFPHTIDKLDDEHSLTKGPRPVFLTDTSLDLLVLRLFGVGSGGGSVDFGADQAIIVRTKERKKQLSKQLDMALVLTVQESKGLEFEDCLILDFFTDTLTSSHSLWRVLYNDIPNNTVPCPVFDIDKHQLLATELKMLYVACTRAKVQLWFFDESESFRQPMLDFWRSQQLVTYIPGSDSETIATMARKSSPEQWAKRGLELYQLKNYSDARKCFKNAGDEKNMKRCDAWIAMVEGDQAEGSKQPELAKTKYGEAAQLFADIGANKHAARAFYKARDFEKAGDLFSVIDEHLMAATAYNKGKIYDKAVISYIKAQQADRALDTCLRGRLWSFGLWILNEDVDEVELARNLHRPSITEEVKRRYIWNVARHFSVEKDKPMMYEYLVRLPNNEDRRKFLKRFKLHDELIALETRANNYDLVAEQYEASGDFLKASENFEKANNIPEAIKAKMRWIRVRRPFDVTMSLEKADFMAVSEHQKELNRLVALLPRSDSIGPLIAEAGVLTAPLVGLGARAVALQERYEYAKEFRNPRLDLYAIQLLLLYHIKASADNPELLIFDLCVKIHEWVKTIQTIASRMTTALEDLDHRGTVSQWSQWAEEYLETIAHSANLPSKRSMFNSADDGWLLSLIDVTTADLSVKAAQRLYSLLASFFRSVLDMHVKARDELEPCPKLFLDPTGGICTRSGNDCQYAHKNVSLPKETERRYRLQAMIIEAAVNLENPRLLAALSDDTQNAYISPLGAESRRAFSMLFPFNPPLHDIEQVVLFRRDSFAVDAVFRELSPLLQRRNDDDIARATLYKSIIQDTRLRIPNFERYDVRRYLLVQSCMHEERAQNSASPDPQALCLHCNFLTGALFDIFGDSEYKAPGKVQPFTLLLLCEKLWVNLAFLHRMNTNRKAVLLPKSLVGFHFLGREKLMSSALGSFPMDDNIRQQTLDMINTLAITLRRLLSDAPGFFNWIRYFKTPPQVTRHVVTRFVSLYLLIGLNYFSYPHIFDPIFLSLREMDILRDDRDPRYPQFARADFRWNDAPYRFHVNVRESMMYAYNYVHKAAQLFKETRDPLVVLKTYDYHVPHFFSSRVLCTVSINSQENPKTFTLANLFPSYYELVSHSATSSEVTDKLQETSQEDLGSPAALVEVEENTATTALDKDVFIANVVGTSEKLNAEDIRSHVSLPLVVVIQCRVWVRKCRVILARRSQVIDLKEQVECEAAIVMDRIGAPQEYRNLYLEHGTDTYLHLLHAIESCELMLRIVQRPNIAIIWPDDDRGEQKTDALRAKKTNRTTPAAEEIKAEVLDLVSDLMEKLQEGKQCIDDDTFHARFDISALKTKLAEIASLLSDTMDPLKKFGELCVKIEEDEEEKSEGHGSTARKGSDAGKTVIMREE